MMGWRNYEHYIERKQVSRISTFSINLSQSLGGHEDSRLVGVQYKR